MHIPVFGFEVLEGGVGLDLLPHTLLSALVHGSRTLFIIPWCITGALDRRIDFSVAIYSDTHETGEMGVARGHVYRLTESRIHPFHKSA